MIHSLTYVFSTKLEEIEALVQVKLYKNYN